MKNSTNRQWLLTSRPKGLVTADDFTYQEVEVADLADGEIRVEVSHIAFDPAMRGWMNEGDSYIPAVGLGEVMRAAGVGRVAETKHSEFQVGDRVSGTFGWQEMAVVVPGEGMMPVQVLPDGVTPEMALSVFGITGLTAYFGMLSVGQVKAGDQVLVSGAAGATGSVAGQIAKIKGARVIGIAGGPEKCAWVKDVAGFDDCIDYKNENLRRCMRDLFPDRLDVYYDNVGGEILENALGLLNVHGRIVLCGGISAYNATRPEPGPRNLLSLVGNSGRMEGFIVFNYRDQYDEAIAEMGTWVSEGKLTFETDVQDGIENAFSTFMRLFEGKNLGKQLLKVAAD